MLPSVVQDEYPDHNPWWASGDVSDSPHYDGYRRSDFRNLYAMLADHDVSLLAGPPGVDRTRTLVQLAARLVADGVAPTDVFYLPCGNPRVQIGGSESITDAVAWYERAVRRSGAGEGEGAYLLVDDAHAVEDWVRQAADVAAEYPDLTVALSVPTVDRVDLSPLEDAGLDHDRSTMLVEKFYDQLGRVLDGERFEGSKAECYGVREALVGVARSGDAAAAADGVAPLHERFAPVERDVRAYVRQYASRGSLVDRGPDRDDLELEPAVYRDVPRFQVIEKRSDLIVLCAIAALGAGETHSIETVRDLLGCDRRTLGKYVDVLGDFRILTASYQYDYQRHREVRLYLRDPVHLVSLADVATTGPVLTADAERKVYSTVVFDHAVRLAYWVNERPDPAVHFWSDDGDRVEFVVEDEAAGEPVPVALAVDRSPEAAAAAVRNFCATHDCEGGTVVYPGEDVRAEGEVLLVPTWLFLTAC